MSQVDHTDCRNPVEVRSVVPGIDWPGIGNDAAAHLQGLLYQMESTQWLPPNRLLEHQMGQARHLLRHAQSSVPYYAGKLRSLNIENLCWETFQEIPLLSRKTLQEDFESLKSNAVPAGHGPIVEGRSTGSTGMPVRFHQTAVTQLFWNALSLREHLWQGRKFSGKLAAIRVKVEEGRWPDWGFPVAVLYRTGPGVTLNVIEDVEKQLDWLQREDPDYLITHASNLAALAELALARGTQIPNLRQARSFSETLRPDLRELVRAAWGVEIADIYSCEEVGLIAFQCHQRDQYHIQAENLLVEIIDDYGRPCRSGNTGRVVVTTLHNFAMPLIRYAIGDYAEVGEPCGCGRGLPVIARIRGRQRNMLILPDGRRHWPSFPTSMWHAVAPIRQFQVIQTEVDRLEISYAMDRPLNENEKRRLETALASILGHHYSVLWKKVEAIERGPGRKYEDFISRVAYD